MPEIAFGIELNVIGDDDPNDFPISGQDIYQLMRKQSLIMYCTCDGIDFVLPSLTVNTIMLYTY